jgi:hypothetical protein
MDNEDTPETNVEQEKVSKLAQPFMKIDAKQDFRKTVPMRLELRQPKMRPGLLDMEPTK